MKAIGQAIQASAITAMAVAVILALVPGLAMAQSGPAMLEELARTQRNIAILEGELETRRLQLELEQIELERQRIQEEKEALNAPPAPPPQAAAPPPPIPPMMFEQLQDGDEDEDEPVARANPVIQEIRGTGSNLVATIVMPDGTVTTATSQALLPGGWEVIAVDAQGVTARRVGEPNAMRLAFGTSPRSAE